MPLPEKLNPEVEGTVIRLYLPEDFDQEVFDNIWRVWPEPLRGRAAKATLAERRKLAFARYGL